MAKTTPTTMIMTSKVRTTHASAPTTAGLGFGGPGVVLILEVVYIVVESGTGFGVMKSGTGVGVMESGTGVGVVESGTGVGVVESGTGFGVVESGTGVGVVESGTGVGVVESGTGVGVVESGTDVGVVESATSVRAVAIAVVTVIVSLSDAFVGGMLSESDIEGGCVSVIRRLLILIAIEFQRRSVYTCIPIGTLLQSTIELLTYSSINCRSTE